MGHSRYAETFALECLPSSGQGPLPVLVCTPFHRPSLHSTVRGKDTPDVSPQHGRCSRSPPGLWGPRWGPCGPCEPGRGREPERSCQNPWVGQMGGVLERPTSAANRTQCGRARADTAGWCWPPLGHLGEPGAPGLSSPSSETPVPTRVLSTVDRAAPAPASGACQPVKLLNRNHCLLRAGEETGSERPSDFPKVTPGNGPGLDGNPAPAHR